jgi:GDSL-like Lipase/Acylhydrolase family
MPLLSRTVPAHASNASGGNVASNAQDASNTSTWSSSSLPAWLAYDLSSVAVGSRQRALIAIYAERSNDYDNTGQIGAWQQMPLDYVIETNGAPGGGAPPAGGWTPLVTVNDNVLAAPQHLVELGGASWVRVRVTRASDPATVSLDVDVYSAPNGGTDSWLFLGDSITSMTFQRLFQDRSVAQRVNDRDPSRWPAQIGGGLGGTNSGTALGIIDARLAAFPGRYVVLAYGTNDGDATSYRTNMTTLVNKIIAAGKTPVIPTVPWTSTRNTTIALNAVIADLYAAYPQVLRGPDLYGLTEGRTDYIPSGDVHPTDTGRAAIVAAYAAVM